MTHRLPTLRTFRTLTLHFIALLGISACGGGGGSSVPPPPPPPGNLAPTADAGADQNAAEDSVVTLAGSGADSDGGTLSYAWSQVSGPAGSFTAADAATTDFSIPTIAVGNEEDLVLRLTVSDGQGGSTSDDVSVTASSTDFVLYTAPDAAGRTELFRFDPQTDALLALNESGTRGSSVLSFSAAFSPDGQSIAYLAVETPNIVLNVVNADGSGRMALTPPTFNGLVREFTWSPDSARLAYTADPDIPGTQEVFVVDRDGANHEKINGTVGVNASVYLRRISWSPDSRYVAQGVFDSSDDRFAGINTFDSQLGAANSTRVTNLPSTGAILDYGWSPDSTGIAYLADQEADDVVELFVALPDGSDIVKINPMLVADGNVESFAWSVDGGRIAYLADQNTDTQLELFAADPDGSNLNTINGPLVAGGGVSSYAWSPTDAAIAYDARETSATWEELFVTDANGGNRVRLNNPPARDSYVGRPDWSHDGTRILFFSDQDIEDVPEIFVATADGANLVKVNEPLVAGRDALYAPLDVAGAWSVDDSRILYRADTFADAEYIVYAGNPDGTTPTAISPPPIAGGGPSTWAKWSADGTAAMYLSRPNDPAVYELVFSLIDGQNPQTVTGAAGPQGFVGSDFLWSK